MMHYAPLAGIVTAFLTSILAPSTDALRTPYGDCNVSSIVFAAPLSAKDALRAFLGDNHIKSNNLFKLCNKKAKHYLI